MMDREDLGAAAPSFSALHDFWLERGGVESAPGVIDHFGKPLREYEAAVSGCALLDLSARARVAVAGKDAARFLHGQCSGDVNALAAWQSVRAFILDNQAHPFAEVFIVRRAGDFLVDGPERRALTLAPRLDRYLLGDKAALAEVREQTVLLHLCGPRAAELLARLGLEAHSGEQRRGEDTVQLWPRRRTPEGGFDLLCGADGAARLAEPLLAEGAACGLQPAGAAALEMLRIEAGIPACDVDYTEQNILPELGIADAVSHAKGCYIGQETVERVRARGHVNRRLAGLTFAGMALPPAGSALHAGEGGAGTMTSAIFSPRLGHGIGLGLVRGEIPDGATVAIRTDAATLSAVVTALPFVAFS
jgi:folate-binding protein YgfZ